MSAAGPKKELYEATSASDLLRIFAEKIEDLERDLTGEAKKFLEGASSKRVPLSRPVVEQVDTPAPRPDGAGDAQAYAGSNPAGATSGNAAQPPTEDLRECEGCSQWKPVEEMAVCFLPGTGESYQCEACRGGP